MYWHLMYRFSPVHHTRGNSNYGIPFLHFSATSDLNRTNRQERRNHGKDEFI